MIDEKIFKKVSVLVIFLILALLTIFVLSPIATSILIGLILAFIFYPVYKKVLFFVKEKNISAIIIIILVMFIIFLPLWFLLPLLVRQVFNMYLFFQNFDFVSIINTIFPSLIDVAGKFASSINKLITNIVSGILSSSSGIIFNLPTLALRAVVVLFVFFFGMRDGELFLNYVKSLSPFSKSAELEFEKKFKQITNSVVYGHFVVGIVQGLFTGIGLFVFGVPQALVLTAFAMFLSVIPVLGAWMVWLPSSIYLFATDHILQGIGLFLYGAIFISWMDNIMRSYIVSKKAKISSAIVFVGMIGGLIVFGFLGLLLGPLILAYLLLILDAYRNKKFPALFS